MIFSINFNQSFTIANYSTEFIALPVIEIENRLNKFIPTVDRTSNWLGAIGIFVTVVLGVISYLCVDVAHRPPHILSIILLLAILGALVFAGYLLYKSYNPVGVEKIIEELRKDYSQAEIQFLQNPQEGQKVDKNNKPSPPASIFQSKGNRIKKKGKKHRR